MMNEKISIIIPVYNCKKYLVRCLDSIKAQTWDNLEILLMDDGSTDGSGEICDDYAKGDRRFVVYHLPHGGVVAARNYALEQFTGNYFMFVDADDLVCEQYAERLYEVLIQENAQVVTCIAHDEDNWDISEYHYSGKKEPIHTTLDMYDFTQDWSHRVIWGAIYRKEILGDIRFRSEYDVSTDTLFFAEILAKVKETVHLNEELYCYIYYHESLAHGKFDRRKYSDIRVWERVGEIFRNAPEMVYISAKTNVVLHGLEALKKLYSYSDTDQKLCRDLMRHVRGKAKIIRRSTLPETKKKRLMWFCRMPALYMRLYLRQGR